jgi:hypothetical protein
MRATALPVVLPKLQAFVVPLNLNDWRFDEGSTTLSSSHPLEKYTDSLYQVVLASSLRLRLKAASLVQRSAPDLQEALNLGNKIEERIDNKSQVVRLQNHGAAPSNV